MLYDAQALKIKAKKIIAVPKYSAGWFFICRAQKNQESTLEVFFFSLKKDHHREEIFMHNI